MKQVAVAAACVVLLTTGAFAQHGKAKGTPGAKGTSGTTASEPVMFYPAEAKWSPAPNSLPEGSEVTIIEGDPTKAGEFTLQLKMPDGYRIAPHWHPADERLTMVKGTLMMGMGDKWDDGSMKEMEPGAYVVLPRKNAHYVESKGESIIQVQGMGPFNVTYLNPSDDPRKGKGADKDKK